MSWPRALVGGIAVVALAFVLLVIVPDYLVSEVTGVERSTRVLLATGFFAVALLGLLFGLRRLQARSMRR
jgi:hypothetical protein